MNFFLSRVSTAQQFFPSVPAMPLPHIDVCICTFRRPELLRRLLEHLDRQVTEGRFTFSIVVADNDPDESAEKLVRSFGRDSNLEVVYCSQPERTIALTRNASIVHGGGELIGLIDDDEFPSSDWLLNLYTTLKEEDVAAVLGPVRPHFDSPPPKWVIKGKFCERPEYPTGTKIAGSHCRTGNVLFRRDLLRDGEEPFRAEFGTGGEDKDFFLRHADDGHTFVWCNEAPVFESVPKSRLTRSYMLQRALLRGKINLGFRNNKWASLAKSSVAVISYGFLIPFALIRGHDRFMHLMIRLCDHAGKLLAFVGLNPIEERRM